MIDHTLAEPRRHYCRPPAILRFDEPDEPEIVEGEEDWSMPTIVMVHRVGTRFTCDSCGQVWVVVFIPEEVGLTMVTCARHEWARETRAQRRQRLGLRWWQREVQS